MYPSFVLWIASVPSNYPFPMLILQETSLSSNQIYLHLQSTSFVACYLLSLFASGDFSSTLAFFRLTYNFYLFLLGLKNEGQIYSNRAFLGCLHLFGKRCSIIDAERESTIN